MTDHILKELRAIKGDLAKECDHDLRRLFDKLKKAEKSVDRQVVNRTNRHSPKADSGGGVSSQRGGTE